MRAFALASVWLLAGMTLVACPLQRPDPAPRRDAGLVDAAVTPAALVDAGSDAEADAATPEPVPPPEAPSPPALDADFTHRLRHLLDAIATNDAALCHDVQLPRKAYVEDYATKDLARAWDRGIDASFKKTLAKLHRRQKKGELTFVSLDVPKAMELGATREHEGWKVQLWRAEHAKLHAKPTKQGPGDAKDVVIDLPVLVYWRGAWYVERL